MTERPDKDLRHKSAHELRMEAQRLRNAIRTHRDEKGHDRCWLDDQELYKVLPEKTQADFTLPPEGEFLKECRKFYYMRQCRTECTES